MNDLSSGLATTSRSGCVPAATWTHEGHVPQGSNASSGRVWQSMAWASFRAKVRLPTPAGPANKKLLASRPANQGPAKLLDHVVMSVECRAT